MTIIACCTSSDGRLFMLADALVGRSVQYPALTPKLFVLPNHIVYGVSGDCFAWDERAFEAFINAKSSMIELRRYFTELAASGVDVGVMFFDPALAPLPVIFYSGSKRDGSECAVTFVGKPGAKPATGSQYGLAVVNTFVEGGSLPDIDILSRRVEYYHKSHGYDDLPVRTIQLLNNQSSV